MSKAIVIYTTRTGNTKKIAELIGEGVRFSGHEADVVNASEIKNPSSLQGYDGYIFGAPTYHGEMTKGIKTLLFMAENAGLENKVGGAFGAFGWSGEAPERIFNTMKNIFQMDMVSGPLMLKDATLGGGIQAAQEYGKAVGSRLK